VASRRGTDDAPVLPDLKADRAPVSGPTAIRFPIAVDNGPTLPPDYPPQASSVRSDRPASRQSAFLAVRPCGARGASRPGTVPFGWGLLLSSVSPEGDAPPRKQSPISGSSRAPLLGERTAGNPTSRKDRNMTNGKKMKQLVAAIERGEGEARKTYWNRIGVAFENRDGSWNLIFDYLPARMDATTIQLRDVEAKDQKAE